jgi:peptide-methionine (S)-S-oxide reductase
MNEMTNDPASLATFAAGCFWGVEHAFRNVPGVIDVRSGYEGGTTEHPTYRDVCSGRTGHAEVVRIRFDPSRTTYEALLDTFWSIHDPTAGRPGAEVGTQYRSSIFFHSLEQRAAAEASKARLAASGRLGRPIVTEIVPASRMRTSSRRERFRAAARSAPRAHHVRRHVPKKTRQDSGYLARSLYDA